MNNTSKSRRGISPILATLLLIVIAAAAVIVTYAWIMTFTGSTANQEGAVLMHENVRFYNDAGTLKVEFAIRNSGTADDKVVEVYQGNSNSELLQVNSVTYDPATQMISEGYSCKITFDITWTSGTRYYFKVATEKGLIYVFSEEA